MTNVKPPVRARVRATRLSNAAEPPSLDDIQQAIFDLKIEHVEISALKPPPRELRKHGPEQIQLLRKSVRTFGQVKAIIVDKDNVIVSGYGVYRAGKAEGLRTLAVVRLERLTPEEIRLYRLMDNQSALMGEDDPDLIRLELGELAELSLELNLDLDLTGISEPRRDELLMEPLPQADEDGVGEDGEDFEPAPGEPVTRLGDLWLVGDHRIYCGNSLEEASYEAVLGDERADMVAADSPYDLPASMIGGRGRNKHPDFQFAYGNLGSERFIEFQTTSFKLVAKWSKNGSLHYQFMDWRHAYEMIAAGREAYTEYKALLVWRKTNASNGWYRSQHELCFVFKSGTEPHYCSFGMGPDQRYRSNVITHAGCNTFRKGRDQDLADHATVKPIPLIAGLIRDASRRGEIVLDNFGGSGTTLLSAEWTGRRARLIELEPRYVDVTLRRARDRYGLEAVLAATGQTFGDVAQERGIALAADVEDDALLSSDDQEGGLDG